MWERWFTRLLVPAIVAVCLVTTPANARELAGTAWQLKNITFMNDRIDVPDRPSKYTLNFHPDGAAEIIADCNRGTSTWISQSAGQLQFGPVASTRALCTLGSLSERYLSQFEWIRSYLLQGDHLFLATMSDGAIIEFAPLGDAPLAARVLGEEIRTADPAEMQEAILSRLFDQYATQHGIVATEDEISISIENMKRGLGEEGLTDEDDLTQEEAEQIAAMRREMTQSIIRQWKTNRQLYSEYGGRVIYQQLGPEPLDAYRRFIEERQRAGAFTIVEESYKTPFWRYFTDDTMHTFFEPGSEASAFEVPPWERR